MIKKLAITVLTWIFVSATPVLGNDLQAPLRVGINKAMPPFSFFDSKASRYRGFCVDLTRLMGGGLNRSIRFVPMHYRSLLKALSDGDIDVISGYVDTTVDLKQFHTINTTVEVESGFFVNKSCLTVTCAKDLAGQIVALEEGQDIGKYVESPQTVNFVETANQAEALAMVSDGFAKAFISHNVLATRYLIQKDNLEDIKEVGISLDAVPLSMILRKGDVDLISEMSFVFGKLMENEKYQTLDDKWFGRSYGPTFWGRYGKYFVGILVFIGMLLIFFMYMNRSLTRRVRKVGQHLQLSEKRYRELIESSPDMITMTDRDGTVVLANRRTQDLFEYRSQELVSMTMLDLLDEPLRNEMSDFISEVFENGMAHASFKARTKTGGSIYLEIVARTIQHEIGKQEMACFFCRDISQRKLLEKELIDSERMAVMGQMAAGLAHEINNPLGIILANTEEVLYEETDPEADKECLQAIERNAIRAAGIIENLLSFNRPSRSEKTNVDATHLVEEALFFLRQKLKSSNIKVKTNYEKSAFTVFADENQFQQMVVNLVLNSIEAMPSGGTLRINLRTEIDREPPVLILTVKDDGSGIPREELSKIFNPFFTARKHKGFGLGLFITKKIIEEHHGHISVSSRQDKGTTMQVDLPLVLNSSQKPPDEGSVQKR